VLVILWLNHHHFFNNFNKTSCQLLWHNNLFLLWVVLIPFITNFLGNNPTQTLVISIYGLVMALAVASFLLMVNYVFFRTNVVDEKISLQTRKKELNRGWPALLAYLTATFLSPVSIWISLAIFVLVPVWYFIPTFLVVEEEK